jgi:segregation and condensation protein A
MAYELKAGEFQGPLEKLLELIEARKMEITAINLAEVTNDFLQHLESLKTNGGGSPELIADFLLIASKLILIKSKALLPSLPLTTEEEADIHELEARLKLYREFAGGKGASGVSAVEVLKNLWSPLPKMYGRTLFTSLKNTPVFYPPSALQIKDLATSLEGLIRVFEAFKPDEETVQKKFVSIEEKIQELLKRFQETVSHSFKAMSENRPRGEIVALFLAMLHLLKSKNISVEQKGQFDDIIIQKM